MKRYTVYICTNHEILSDGLLDTADKDDIIDKALDLAIKELQSQGNIDIVCAPNFHDWQGGKFYYTNKPCNEGNTRHIVCFDDELPADVARAMVDADMWILSTLDKGYSEQVIDIAKWQIECVKDGEDRNSFDTSDVDLEVLQSDPALLKEYERVVLGVEQED